MNNIKMLHNFITLKLKLYTLSMIQSDVKPASKISTTSVTSGNTAPVSNRPWIFAK